MDDGFVRAIGVDGELYVNREGEFRSPQGDISLYPTYSKVPHTVHFGGVSYSIGRIVLETFVGPPPTKYSTARRIKKNGPSCLKNLVWFYGVGTVPHESDSNQIGNNQDGGDMMTDEERVAANKLVGRLEFVRALGVDFEIYINKAGQLQAPGSDEVMEPLPKHPSQISFNGRHVSIGQTLLYTFVGPPDNPFCKATRIDLRKPYAANNVQWSTGKPWLKPLQQTSESTLRQWNLNLSDGGTEVQVQKSSKGNGRDEHHAQVSVPSESVMVTDTACMVTIDATRAISDKILDSCSMMVSAVCESIVHCVEKQKAEAIELFKLELEGVLAGFEQVVRSELESKIKPTIQQKTHDEVMEHMSKLFNVGINR